VLDKCRVVVIAAKVTATAKARDNVTNTARGVIKMRSFSKGAPYWQVKRHLLTVQAPEKKERTAVSRRPSVRLDLLIAF
jgi:hypothetical protein